MKEISMRKSRFNYSRILAFFETKWRRRQSFRTVS